MMESAKKWLRQNATNGMYRSRRRRVLVDRQMRASRVIQQRLRTPTGVFFARFFIGIILGLVAELAFMRPSTRLMMSSFVARWMGRQQNVGWKFQHGCSTGRPAPTPSL
jgi:hypothetical protein